ncbi:hypothetical protein [Salicola sp. Rm-C-2C1-2]|uniref:hypothetical protein n=1 Tax=Salicola sp. Rm-C-2C1-2 TaxID=3141321 RepID=UPI0032E4A646
MKARHSPLKPLPEQYHAPAHAALLLGCVGALWLFMLQARVLSTSLFSPVEDRVPEFLDWYYSLRGEYTRLGCWALEALGFEVRDDLAQRLEELNGTQRVMIRRTLTPLDTIKKTATGRGGQTERG